MYLFIVGGILSKLAQGASGYIFPFGYSSVYYLLQHPQSLSLEENIHVRLTMLRLRPHYSRLIYQIKLPSRLSSSIGTSAVPGPIDEELNPNYDAQKYYPVQIGQSVGKYRVLSKLGWGISSTAWLAKDLSR